MCDVVCQYAFLPFKLLSNVNMFSEQSFSTIVLKSTTSPSISAHVATLANPSLIFFAIKFVIRLGKVVCLKLKVFFQCYGNNREN